MSIVETKKNQRYFIGFESHILEDSNGLMTLEDLHNDPRLMIIENAWVFTDEPNRDEVLRNYEIDERHVETLEYWWRYASGDFYMNHLDGEIEYSEIVNRVELDEMFQKSLNNMDKNELSKIDMTDLYIRLAKKAIIDNMRSEADRLEKEWSETGDI